MGGYAPVGFYSDEDELLNGGDYGSYGGYAPAAPAPSAVAPVEPGSPASAMMPMAPPVTSSAPPVTSAAPAASGGYAAPEPAAGSTEDLENRGFQSKITPPVAAPRPQWKDFAPAQPQGWKAKLGHIMAGFVGPLNYAYNVEPRQAAQRAYKNATAEYEAPLTEEKTEALTEQEQAKADQERARANALRNPPAGVAKTPLAVYTAAVQEAVAAGRDPNTDPKVQQLADAVTSVQPVKTTPSQKAVTLKLPSGQQVAGKVDHEGNLLTEDGKAAPQGTMLFQQPNYGQLVLPTKTIDVIGENGLPTKMGWNEQTQQYDRPMGVSATGAYGHEMAQAGAVERGGTDLIAQLQQPENREILGQLSSYISQGTLGTPLADQRAAYLSAQLKTFAALQPAMHGFRSHSAQETFEKIVGGLAQDPDATIGAIRGILQTSRAINPNQGGGENSNTHGGGEKIEYKPGLVRHGYKFKGGDPTDKDNWEKQ